MPLMPVTIPRPWLMAMAWLKDLVPGRHVGRSPSDRDCVRMKRVAGRASRGMDR